MRGQNGMGRLRYPDATAHDLPGIVGRMPSRVAESRGGVPLALAATLVLAFVLAFMAVVLLQGEPVRAQTQATSKYVRLTFDDVPVRGNTRRVLDVLRNKRVKATFFVIGQQARANPALVRRAHHEGHSVQNHSYTHANLTTLSNTGIRRELSRTNRAIVDAGVPRPYRFRPPYGATNARVRSIGTSLGLTQTLWTVDPRDWADPPASVVCSRVLNNVRSGSIVLLHDGTGANTDNALPCIINGLRARGYSFRKL